MVVKESYEAPSC